MCMRAAPGKVSPTLQGALKLKSEIILTGLVGSGATLQGERWLVNCV